jgi:ferric-dicitrate binding protein FerR (iron transport regulator)
MNRLKENNQSISQLAEKLIHHYQIPFNKSSEEALDTIFKKISKTESTNRNNSKITWFIRAAVSVAATAAILIAFYIMSATVSYRSGDNEIVACRLPDQSRVVLDHNSSVTLNKYFWKGNVRLAGKAYFEVVKNQKFKVITESGEVEVLGTRFTVESNDRNFNVECFQGTVRTYYKKESWQLDPGTKFSGDHKNSIKTSMEDDAGYPDFALFQHSFSSEKLPLVFDKLESFFGVDIEIESGSEKHFSGTIQTGSLESAIRIICEPLELKYVFTKENRIIISQ